MLVKLFVPFLGKSFICASVLLLISIYVTCCDIFLNNADALYHLGFERVQNEIDTIPLTFLISVEAQMRIIHYFYL